MKNIRCVIAAVVVAAVPFSAAAQDEREDDRELRGPQIVIEVDDDGRLIVNGSRLSESEGPVVLRVRPEDGEVEVEKLGPHRGVVVYDERGKLAPGAVHGWDADWFAALPSDFQMPDIPAIKPLIQGFHFEPGEDFKFNLDEHFDVGELERESQEMAREARNAEGAEREELEAELRSKLGEIFDKKIELRRDRIERLRDELQEDQEALDERSEAREEMIERRLRRLMGEGDVLEW